MEKNFLLKNILAGAVCFLLLFPVLHLLAFIPLGEVRWDPLLSGVLWRAFLQSTLSTVLTLCLGFWGAWALLCIADYWGEKSSRTLQFLILIPSVLPPLVVVLLVSHLLGFVMTGLVGVVFFHVILNSGLASVLLTSLLREKCEPYWQQAQIMGVTGWRTLIQVLLPLLRTPLILMSLYFFLLYFLSFSIPLLVGGGRFGGPEVYLYERILGEGSWGETIVASLGLFAFVFVFSLLLRNQSQFMSQITESRAYRSKWGLVFILILIFPLVVILSGLLIQTPHLLTELFRAESWHGSMMTLRVGLGVGLTSFFLLSGVSYIFSRGWFRGVLFSWVTPGWVLIGFSFLLLSGESGLSQVLLLVLALSLIYVPFLYRLSFVQVLESLEQQVEMTNLFSVSWNQVFLRIIWPQCLPMISLLSGLATLWACGDFAMSEMLLSSSSEPSLAMLIKESLATYRFDQAMTFLLPLLMISFGLFLAFQGIPYVTGQKTLSRSRSFQD